MNDDTMLSGIGKEFATLDPLFKQHGWYTSKNEANYVSYTTAGRETDVFEIKLDASKTIRVSMPIRNSPFQYRTSFQTNSTNTCRVETLVGVPLQMECIRDYVVYRE